jgi:hypothetical protein
MRFEHTFENFDGNRLARIYRSDQLIHFSAMIVDVVGYRFERSIAFHLALDPGGIGASDYQHFCVNRCNVLVTWMTFADAI